MANAGNFDRSVLTTNDQNNGDTSDITKIESIHTYIADLNDANFAFIQQFEGTPNYAADAGTTDAYAVTLTDVAAYTDGLVVRFKANTANTGAASLTVNALGVIAIKKNVTSDLATGDILANQPVEVMYLGGSFHMLSRSSISYLPLAGGIVTGALDVRANLLSTSPTTATKRARLTYSDVDDAGIIASEDVGTTYKKVQVQGSRFTFRQGFSGLLSEYDVITSETIMSGTGSPEGVVTAPVKTLFLRSDGGASTTLYVKQSGTGNTGWVAK